MASIDARHESTGALRRPARRALGAALVAGAVWLGVAFATWTIDDPSLSYANGNAVRNLAGGAGAVAADLGMQVFGLACVLLPLVLAIRGILMLVGRRVGRSGSRAWWALGGLVLASAALGSLEAPAGWPLPIGLGGIAGDVVLKVPAIVTGAYPTGALGMILAVLFALPAAWCLLTGAGLVGRVPETLAPGEHGAPGERERFASDDEEDEREGRFQLLAGVAGHWAYAARSAVTRRVGDFAEMRRRRADPFAHREWDAEAPLLPPAPEPRLRDPQRGAPAAAAAAVREVRVVQPPYFDDAFGEVDPDEAGDFVMPAPAARTAASAAAFAATGTAAGAAMPALEAPEPQAARRTVDTSRATVRHGRSDWNGSYKVSQRDARQAAKGGEPHPDDRDDPRFDDETDGEIDQAGPFGARETFDEPRAFEADTDADAYEDDVREDWHDEADERERTADLGDETLPTLEERIAAEADESALDMAGERREPADEPEANGGWRGFLANNIVAFPGLKRAARPEPEPVRAPVLPRPAAPPARPQPSDARPTAPLRPQAAPVRVVSAASGDGVSRQSSRARLAELGNPEMNARFELPPIDLLSPPRPRTRDNSLTPEILQENARLLEGVLDDFGVKGEIIEVRPGPVVTLYELEPAPGIKSSRVIGLADDIARSMSAIAARVAVIPGKNAIGIELPNQRRETVYFREMLASETFTGTKAKLALALGKTIGGEAVIADLAKMPHLLVAGTTGSGKSVSINTMILSLLYRMTPAECRMIMIDPKMLELSIYDGIPHLLSPVVTDPKKAVVALKWTVREMEDRYRKMSKVGVRNIDGFNARVAGAIERGETISRTVQTGFDRESGEPIFESEEFDLAPLPYIVVIIDEMADLMMVAGKDIEGTVQRLAQMARAAGIHVIMATQRPSVDVITGTIKANFPTRISFQVTSKIDSRTILQEQGAEQLLGMGDMLFMAGGGRIQRVHGPFVDDAEVEEVVRHLKSQGVPDYLDAILEDEDEEGGAPGKDGGAKDGGGMDESADLYDQAVAVVLRDGKASTSYVQRRLQIGYNRAASIIERMEREGIVGPANHAGKREILVPTDNA
ncbi:DNA segregation ATPase FtsK/SpoIIIE-like protein [Aureimonas pseudogalii]|uniref:DNA translocase FtsK n=2 Tax=Aureimonas pseudogalii TaxID=1744844 RepID=A0A7W6H708_9HYPH|nr:DNA segregation ATPase FtsK/SpoIIIE-like protein [Aureimonas pseudogalii]